MCVWGGEAFQWNSHFVQIKKSPCHGERVSWERGAGLFVVGKGVDIPQDEVGHCSPSPLKRAFWRNWWAESRAQREWERLEVPFFFGEGGLHYSVILLKALLWRMAQEQRWEKGGKKKATGMWQQENAIDGGQSQLAWWVRCYRLNSRPACILSFAPLFFFSFFSPCQHFSPMIKSYFPRGCKKVFVEQCRLEWKMH